MSSKLFFKRFDFRPHPNPTGTHHSRDRRNFLVRKIGTTEGQIVGTCLHEWISNNWTASVMRKQD
jgi:hypothetical protein